MLSIFYHFQASFQHKDPAEQQKLSTAIRQCPRGVQQVADRYWEVLCPSVWWDK